MTSSFYFCKRMNRGKSKMEPAANAVTIVAFKKYLTSTTVS
jgi:hypothetical protein